MKNNILAVSNDAGGAELLSSYLKAKNKELCFRCVVNGPAEQIFIRKGLRRFIIDSAKAKELIAGKKFGLVLTSASWSSDLEVNFIRLAKEHEIKTTAILDHWLNYRGRLKSVPDEIWVVDDMARKIARSDFGSDVRIKVKPNYYFKEFRSAYRSINVVKDRKYINILFLSEPNTEFRAFKNQKIKMTEVEKVMRLINYLKAIVLRKPIFFKIRQHPIETPAKYLSVIKYISETGDLKVALSDPKDNSLVEDIKRSDIVIGMRSPALIVASLFKDTIAFCTSFPLWFSAYNIKHIGLNLYGLGRFLTEDGTQK